MVSILPVGLLLLSGCKSHPFGPYISPRVTGEVLAADTSQPLAHVNVIRGSQQPPKNPSAKGGEIMMRKPPVQTDASGKFELASERVLSVFRGAGWNMVSLAFDRSGYERFHTNCPMNAVTNTASGEPVLNVGRIFLRPHEKQVEH